MYKLQDRKSVFGKAKFKNEEEKALWNKIMTTDFMSSDESGTDNGEEVLISKPLPWESTVVMRFKRKLDDAALEEKTPLAKKQMKPRRLGAASSRSKPPG